MCKKSLGNNNNGILRYWCEELRGEYLKNNTFLYLVFLCIYGYRGLFPWLVCFCRCSITCLAQPMSSYFALSLVGSVSIHCIPLSVGVLVGHCGSFVATFIVQCASHN